MSKTHLVLLSPLCSLHADIKGASELTVRESFFSFQSNPKNLDPSYKMDLDFWDCLGRVKLIL